MPRFDRLRQIESLDPETDYHRIYRLHAHYEFPWDVARALELALYRTYAVPTIGALLDRTGEFRRRPQKRYDDTALLLGEVLNHGLAPGRGRDAVRRINGIHGRYRISNEDMLYVLATFVVVPIRWLERYGWRPPVEAERRATHLYYADLGRHMGIGDIPASYDALADFLDAYEAAHLRYTDASRRTAEATRELFVSWFPRPLAPLTRLAVRAMLDRPLLEAFGFRPAPAVVVCVVDLALRVRGRVVRCLPARRTPVRTADHRTIATAPGYRIDDLGPA